MLAITAERLRAFAPVAKPEIIAAILARVDELDQARITTNPLRLHHFLAQVAVESGGLRRIEENLSYTAERAHEVWPNRFPTIASARPYARNPQKLAEKVYGGRMGNTKPGMAWTYRGSGLMQTTGYDNFKAAGHESDPDTLRTPAGALTAAIKFWTDNGLNLIADRDDVAAVRRRVNGGTNGLAEARNYLAKAKRIFTDEAEDDHPEELSRARVKALQEQLIKLGYVQLGKPDGRVGGMTIGAVSAFQAENGLPVTGRFDEATQSHLYEAAPRQVVRASEEPEGSRIVGAARTMKKGAVGLLGVSVADLAADPLSAIEGVKSKMTLVDTLLAPLKAGSAFLTQHWLLVVVAIAAAVWLYSHRIEQARLEDHASGASA